MRAAYGLFVDVRENAVASGYDWFEWWNCDYATDQFLFEGILDNLWTPNDVGWYDYDWERADAFLNDVDFSDPHGAARAWRAVLTYLMMDYRYLYLN